ncbi:MULTISPECIES: hypothetical protein [Streptomyces]|uniref:hypothetical protein n=1 Tax=Streptomyces TaxID=1883 RepID=UPI0011E4CBC9|nr:hypothetical protein [Streptomyces sp. MOE7]
MRKPNARLFEALLRRLFPASGRRRAGAPTQPPEANRPLPGRPHPWCGPVVRGEDTVLVRPYLVAHERAHGLEAVA